ncbi:tyrosine-type recombinase/integrase [Comamonas nitrativorans]|uniref:Tyrosine-type recombinase/integrase n=1 Tax=Comamonas nitrativorans TaxID=108437 RepID=A0ABV9H100_9BURK
MAKIAKELTAMAVSKLKGEGAYAVGGVPGLQLQILGASRAWVLRFVLHDKRRRMGLGSYPAVSLAEARDRARLARSLIRSGIDPIDQRTSNKETIVAAAAKSLTFAKAAEKFIAAHEDSWSNAKHRLQWVSTIGTYANPIIGQLPVAAIEQRHILQILDPIWRSKTETASRLRGRIEQVLNWAKVQGLCEGPNPARWRDHLDLLLPAPEKVSPVKHLAAVPLAEAKLMWQLICGTSGMGAQALQLQILTAGRSGEARGAKWSELDLDSAVWVIPKERMKAKREHRIPLPRQAVELLRKQPRIVGAELVFPSSRNTPLSDMTLTAVMRRLKRTEVPHGWRSTFRDWVGDCTDYPSELAEIALAHSVGSKVEQAYRRGDMLEKRRPLMQEWADFLTQTP